MSKTLRDLFEESGFNNKNSDEEKIKDEFLERLAAAGIVEIRQFSVLTEQEVVERTKAEKLGHIACLRLALAKAFTTTNKHNKHIISDPLFPTPSRLNKDDVERYSRQLILPEIAASGQIKLKEAKVLIVGAGGLGCPVSMYLAAAGVGHIGIIDGDDVELSNLHRQVLHGEDKVGVPKAVSIADRLLRLNSLISAIPYINRLNEENALGIIGLYDVVIDASDNAPTRYLINDACVLLKKPLVSGSALRGEGQLTVYNHNSGPCYRCLFPVPPISATVSNCSDSGVMGAVTGVIGSMQAMECIKIITGCGTVLSQKMVLYDGFEGTVRTIKLRSRRPDCAVCGDAPSLKALINYQEFCGAPMCDNALFVRLLDDDKRIGPESLFEDLKSKPGRSLIVDIRPAHHFEICALPSAISVPWSPDSYKPDALFEQVYAQVMELRRSYDQPDKDEPSSSSAGSLPRIVFVCRRGNDSQHAVVKFLALMDRKAENKASSSSSSDSSFEVVDLKGGLHAWGKFDPTFPTY